MDATDVRGLKGFKAGNEPKGRRENHGLES